MTDENQEVDQDIELHDEVENENRKRLGLATWKWKPMRVGEHEE